MSNNNVGGCRIYLSYVGSNKNSVIKLTREYSDLILKDAKELIDSVEKTERPACVLEGISLNFAKSMSIAFEEVGAKCKISNDEIENNIIELLKEKGKKISASDINTFLKIRNIEAVKEICELLYHRGYIDYAGGARYFVLSEEVDKPKSTASNNDNKPEYLSEIKVLLDLFKKEILTKEQFVTQVEEILG